MKQTVNTFMRNRDCVLNHLPIAKAKVRVIEKYGLSRKSMFWPETRRMLEELHLGVLSAKNALERISALSGAALWKVKSDLLSCYQTGLLECHITDQCDLHCIACHYRNKGDDTLPFDALAAYFQLLSPKAITITGGGEPNCYQSQGNTLHDVIKLAKQVNPHVGLGLINNNTHLPAGDWYNDLDWQRTSVDAANAEQYRQIKGVDKYDLCIANVDALLHESHMPFVGIGFLYRKENIESIPSFLTDWFARYRAMPNSAQEKFNIQFRPISPGIEDIARYDPAKEPMEAAMEAAMERSVTYVMQLASGNAAFECFLREKTNFTYIGKSAGSYFLHKPAPFTYCYNALLHRVLRADGTGASPK